MKGIMPTPEEVDAGGGTYGPLEVNGRVFTISRWRSASFEGRSISGRWYQVLSADDVTTVGMIQASTGEFFAFQPYEVGNGLGEAARSLDEAIRILVA